MHPHDQLNWDLQLAVTADCTSTSVAHKPRPPKQGTLTGGGGANVRNVTTMATAVEPQPSPAQTHARHVPVGVAPHQGPVMAPTARFDPTIPSSAPAYQYGHITEQVREAVAVRGSWCCQW